MRRSNFCFTWYSDRINFKRNFWPVHPYSTQGRLQQDDASWYFCGCSFLQSGYLVLSFVADVSLSGRNAGNCVPNLENSRDVLR